MSFLTDDFHKMIKEMKISGLSLEEAEYPPGIKTPPRAYEQANFCIVLHGGCVESSGSKAWEFKSLTAGFLPAGDRHSLNVHQGGAHYFTVAIGKPWQDRARHYSLGLDEPVHCDGELLNQLFMRLYTEFRLADESSPLAIEGLALEMMAEASRQRPWASDRKPPRWLERARDVLHAQFSAPWALVDIAEVVGVHPSHLAREFRKHYRCTLGEYVRRLRVDYACREISTTNAALAEIASAAGFADQSHFSRIFKRHTGLTPAEYQRISARR